MNFLKKIQSASKLKKQKNASTSGSFTLKGAAAQNSKRPISLLRLQIKHPKRM